jgi:outer membrane protein OmpA-like peptidoglycan-associated protein
MVSCLLWLSAAWAWPADSDWVALTTSATPVIDVADDHTTDHDSALDLVGDALAPALMWTADANDTWFRLQVVGDPVDGSFFVPGSWGLLLDTDADPTTFEFVLAAQGPTGQLELWENDGTAGTNVSFEHYDFIALPDATDAVRRTEAGGYYTVDLRISRDELDTHLGIGDVDAIRVAAFTGASVFADRTDVTGCDATLVDCGDLDDVSASPIYIDRDEDLLTDPQEQIQGSSRTDADSDDDGLIDGAEALGDADGDGWTDQMDCDSDGDGILDGTESGLLSTSLHADTDLSANCFLADADTIALPTNPYDWDTDQGTLADGLEDWNKNGKVDEPWETDPTDISDDLDTDGDTIADVLELQGDDADVNDVDSDGDGISDATEWLWDEDVDGIPNFLDLDSDNDGIEDAIEGEGDADGDGKPNFLDTDSDGDGIVDELEGTGDPDGDGLANYLDDDSDGDGILDEFEGSGDVDQDGIDNFLDTDSDGDGILDEVEGEEDTDEDGLADLFDLDSDGDSILDEVEGDDDVDNDGKPNFQDTDSDGDGVPDATELEGDEDCDGVPDYLDNDHDDGFCDTGIDIPNIVDGFEADNATDPDGLTFSGGQFTGGSCSVNPMSAAWLPMGLVLAFMRRRRQTAAAVAALAVAPTAVAQDLGINAQRFSPSVDGRAFVGLEDTQLANAWSYGGTLWINHADDPFVFRPVGDNVDETDVLGTVTTADLAGFYSFGFMRVGLDLPVHLYTAGFDMPRPTNTGDLTLSAKGTFYEVEAGDLGVGVGGIAAMTLPTGAPAAWVGGGTVGAQFAALSTVRWQNLVAAVNLGARTGTGQEIQDLKAAPAFEWGTGVSYAVRSDLWASAEFNGERWFGNSGQAVAPAEWLGAVRYNPWEDLIATIGAGSGLSKGVGAPDYRIVAAIGWTPGRVEVVEEPVVEPISVEAPPPAPGDVVIRAMGPSGAPVPGAEVRILGTLGKPMRTGNDGILEAALPPGDYETAVAAPGWVGQTQLFTVPEGGIVDFMVLLRPEDVVVDKDSGQIFLHRKVFFEVDKAELKLESLHVLDSLVDTLALHPEIAELRVEGHTDVTGTDEHNQELSDARAAAVVSYLEKQGIEQGRLVALGLGESRRLQNGDSDEVHATNRRVEFHIVRLDEEQPSQ